MRIAVIGAGVIGLSTTAWLLEASADVTCYEMAGAMSQRSAGSSRIFRLAHGSTQLIELARLSRQLYERWSDETGVRLISDHGVAVRGAGDTWADTMRASGVRMRVEESAHALGLPSSSLPGPLVVDLEGGVIDARRVGALLISRTASAIVLDTVDAIEPTASGVRIHTATRIDHYDACVIAAGAATPPLAAQAGLYPPTEIYHHLRLTFALRDLSVQPPCLIEKESGWRPDFATYQHLAAPGQWAVGAHVPPSECAWEQGKENTVAHQRNLVVGYTRELLDGVDPEVIDELYCSMVGGWADGYRVLRNGAVVAVHGDNLFKFAPVLGQLLADAALTGNTPPSTLVAPG